MRRSGVSIGKGSRAIPSSHTRHTRASCGIFENTTGAGRLNNSPFAAVIPARAMESAPAGLHAGDDDDAGASSGQGSRAGRRQDSSYQRQLPAPAPAMASTPDTGDTGALDARAEIDAGAQRPAPDDTDTGYRRHWTPIPIPARTSGQGARRQLRPDSWTPGRPDLNAKAARTPGRRRHGRQSRRQAQTERRQPDDTPTRQDGSARTARTGAQTQSAVRSSALSALSALRSLNARRPLPPPPPPPQRPSAAPYAPSALSTHPAPSAAAKTPAIRPTRPPHGAHPLPPHPTPKSTTSTPDKIDQFLTTWPLFA